MLLIEYFPIKANGNIKQKKFDSPYILKEYVFSILYEGNLSRFFLMRDRNRREIFSILTPIAKYSGEKEKMLSYEDYFIKTNNEGNIIQKRWRGNLETFSYDEKGYIQIVYIDDEGDQVSGDGAYIPNFGFLVVKPEVRSGELDWIEYETDTVTHWKYYDSLPPINA